MLCVTFALWASHWTVFKLLTRLYFQLVVAQKKFMEVEQKVVMYIIPQVRTSSSSFPAVTGFIPNEHEGSLTKGQHLGGGWGGDCDLHYTVGWLGFGFYCLFIYPLAYFQLHHLLACISCSFRLKLKPSWRACKASSLRGLIADHIMPLWKQKTQTLSFSLVCASHDRNRGYTHLMLSEMSLNVTEFRIQCDIFKYIKFLAVWLMCIERNLLIKLQQKLHSPLGSWLQTPGQETKQ